MQRHSDPNTTNRLSKLGSLCKGLLQCLLFTGKAILLLLLLYALVVLIGLLPVNREFQPSKDGVKIYLISNAVHADLVLPVNSEQKDWRAVFPEHCFRSDNKNANLVAIGWGDKGFFINTPTWDDLTIATAANALLIPSETCLHVSLLTESQIPADTPSVTISPSQYSRLVDHLVRSFKTRDQQFVLIEGESYRFNDAFFEAHGTYHALNTCNSWVGRSLRAAGIKTPWLTPLPGSPTLYLP